MLFECVIWRLSRRDVKFSTEVRLWPLSVQMLMWVKTSGTSFYYYYWYFCTTTMSPNLWWLPIATSFLLRRTCWQWTMQRSELPSSGWQWHKGRKSGGRLGGWQSSSSNTVGGRNPAQVDRQFIPLFARFFASQVVQDFFHKQYVSQPQSVFLFVWWISAMFEQYLQNAHFSQLFCTPRSGFLR